MLLFLWAIGGVSALAPNLWFNLTVPDVSPLMVFDDVPPEGSSSPSPRRWRTNLTDYAYQWEYGAYASGATQTSVRVDGDEQVRFTNAITDLWIYGTADGNVTSRGLLRDGIGEKLTGDGLLAVINGLDYNRHKIIMRAEGTGILAVHNITFTTGIMSTAASWAEALGSATIVPFVKNGTPNPDITLTESAKGTLTVSDQIGTGGSSLRVDTMQGSHGASFNVTVPPNTTLSMLNATIGPDHVSFVVKYDPEPPLLAGYTAHLNTVSARVTTYNEWRWLGLAHMQPLDPSVQYVVNVRVGDGSYAQNFHSFSFVPGSNDVKGAEPPHIEAPAAPHVTKNTDVSNSAVSTPQVTKNTDVFSSAVPTPPKHRSKIGAIAGGVVGGVLAIVLIAIIVWLCLRRRRRARKPTRINNLDLVDDDFINDEDNRSIANIIRPFRKKGETKPALSPVPFDKHREMEGYRDELLTPSLDVPLSPTAGRNLPPLATDNLNDGCGEKILASPEALFSPRWRPRRGRGRVIEHDCDAGQLVERSGQLVERELLPPMYQPEWAHRGGRRPV